MRVHSPQLQPITPEAEDPAYHLVGRAFRDTPKNASTSRHPGPPPRRSSLSERTPPDETRCHGEGSPLVGRFASQQQPGRHLYR